MRYGSAVVAMPWTHAGQVYMPFWHGPRQGGFCLRGNVHALGMGIGRGSTTLRAQAMSLGRHTYGKGALAPPNVHQSHAGAGDAV